MHSPFRHTALPQMTTPWLAAQATT